MRSILLCTALLLAMSSSVGQRAPVQVHDEASASELDSKLKPYQPAAGIAGTLVVRGSDVLNNLMALWSEEFRKHHPSLMFTVEGKGGGTSPVPLEGPETWELHPASRKASEVHIQQFEATMGYKPSVVVVAFDALAICVHKDNPIEKLTLPQVDAIFSSTRKGKHPKDITTWGGAGLKGDWSEVAITLYGRNSASGCYGFFKEMALFRGDYKSSVKEQPGSSKLVKRVGEDRSGIGYSPLPYETSSVRCVPIADDEKAEAVACTFQTAQDASYPLSRKLYMYFHRKPGEEVPAKVRAFLRFIHSRDGQKIVLDDKFVPLTQAMVEEQAKAYE